MTLVVGLTGGIASGKSMVARLLGELGARVVDADQLARQVVAPGTPGLAEIVAVFGDGVLRPDGSLDRARLGEIVFHDDAARHRLERITHPRIAEALVAEVVKAREEGVAVLVYEAALLVETGAHRAVDRLVVVTAPPVVQVARIRARDGLSEDEARARIEAQASVEEKAAVADHVITNEDSPEALGARVEALWEELCHVH